MFRNFKKSSLGLSLAFMSLIGSAIPSFAADVFNPSQILGSGSIAGSADLNYILPDITALAIYGPTPGKPANGYFANAATDSSLLTENDPAKLITRIARGDNNVVENDFVVKGVIFSYRRNVDIFRIGAAANASGGLSFARLWKDGNTGVGDYVDVSLSGFIGPTPGSTARPLNVDANMSLTSADFDADESLAYFTLNGDIIDYSFTFVKDPGTYVGTIDVTVDQF